MSQRETVQGSEPADPSVQDAPMFAEPWQAEAFAMTLVLHQRGLFSWTEWAEALSGQVHRPGAAIDGSDYYDHWLAALEKLLAAKGLAPTPEVDATAAAWERAAHATPHGKPILLENDPQSASSLSVVGRPG